MSVSEGKGEISSSIFLALVPTCPCVKLRLLLLLLLLLIMVMMNNYDDDDDDDDCSFAVCRALLFPSWL